MAMPTSVTIDLKKMAQDTTFQMHLKVKNRQWWARRVWVVSLFAKLVRFVLGSKVEIEVDYAYNKND